MNVDNLEYKFAKIEDKQIFIDFFKHNFCYDTEITESIQIIPYDNTLSFYFEHSLKYGIPLKIYLNKKLYAICINYLLNYKLNDTTQKLIYIHYIVIKRCYTHHATLYESIIKSVCSLAGIDFYYYKHTVNRNNQEIINSIVSNPLKMYIIPINHYKLMQHNVLENNSKPCYKHTIGALKIINNEPNTIIKILSNHLKIYSSKPLLNKNMLKLFFTKNSITISDGQLLCKIDVVKYIYKESNLILVTGILNILVDNENKFSEKSDEIFTILLKRGIDQLIIREELGNFNFEKYKINNFEEYVLSDSLFCESGVEFFNF